MTTLPDVLLGSKDLKLSTSELSSVSFSSMREAKHAVNVWSSNSLTLSVKDVNYDQLERCKKILIIFGATI